MRNAQKTPIGGVFSTRICPGFQSNVVKIKTPRRGAEVGQLRTQLSQPGIASLMLIRLIVYDEN